jgi:ion channel-forming bestrophin family protein
VIDYDPHRWGSHFFDLKGSMVREIAYRVGICALISIGVSIAYHFHADVAINDKSHLLIGPALSLLLVFRTNSANDRYNEGRRMWGGIMNSSRNLRRKAHTMLAAEPATIDAIVEWTITFAWATRERLLNRKGLGPDPKLPAKELDAVVAASSPPTAVAAQISRILFDARVRGVISDHQLQMLDADVQALIDHLGGCERILTTPLPFAYAVHLRRALVMYCGSLPFALVDTFHEFTVLVSIFVAYILIGIEEIGTEIENPFEGGPNDLPLDRICTNIQTQLRDASNAPSLETR